ncbi:MAG: hypothetical protein JW700_04265 [Candidatus Aenigmarchaeota archaeon]|nr:hypothetical protein [Candidatus Aenigmarchaeota archaeon]
MKNKKFMIKLTENYLNAIMVLVLAVLVYHSITYRDAFTTILAVIWIIAIPFLGTFVDMRTVK